MNQQILNIKLIIILAFFFFRSCLVYVIVITDNLVQRMISSSGCTIERLMHIEKSDIRNVKNVRKELRKLIQQLR